MYRNYDRYGRRSGRSPYITDIPGPGQRGVDPVTEINRLYQQLEQANNNAAEWQQAAEQYHAIAKQQQAETNAAERKLAQLEKKLAIAEQEIAHQAAETQSKTSAESAESADKTNEWQEKYLRLYADFENGKKRLEQRYALESQQKQENLLRDMLPLADNLERAIQHHDFDQPGLEMIQKAFLAALAKHGVEPVAAAERPFDPELHEAVGMVPHPTAESGVIVDVAENGYTYNGKLLRPAKVLVAE
jgi:molecular chaperone GrpE